MQTCVNADTGDKVGRITVHWQGVSTGTFQMLLAGKIGQPPMTGAAPLAPKSQSSAPVMSIALAQTRTPHDRELHPSVGAARE